MITVRNEKFDEKALTDAEFWRGPKQFINCSFRSAYIGDSSRKKNFKRFDLSKIFFRDCDFAHCNFKGAKNLTFRNFTNPQNIGSSRHLPESVLARFKGTTCWHDEQVRAFYQQPGVTNREVTGRVPLEIERYCSLNNGA